MSETNVTESTQEQPKKKIKMPIIIGLVVILLAGAIFGVNYKKHLTAYKEANALYNQGEYMSAAAKFKELGSFKNSKDCVNKSYYAEAIDRMESAEYEDAIDLFEKLDDYEDSKDKIEECKSAIAYEDAMVLYKEKNYEEAQKAFEDLGDYSDSKELAENCAYTIKAQSLDGTKWFYSDPNVACSINVLTFTKENAHITENYFDGNGIHQKQALDYDYTATKDNIVLTDQNSGNQITIPYEEKDNSISLDKNTYATTKMIDKQIQGYWVSSENTITTGVYGRSYYSKRRYDLYLKNGKMKSISANTADPATNYSYFYFGPYEGKYTIGDGRIDFTYTGKSSYFNPTFFTYLNGNVSIYRYDNLYKKSSRTSLPNTSFYDGYFR